MDWKFGVSRCKLLYIGWINNKVLLYSMGNYIQHPVINHNGKGYKKEYLYILYIYNTYVYIYVCIYMVFPVVVYGCESWTIKLSAKELMLF